MMDEVLGRININDKCYHNLQHTLKQLTDFI